MITLAFALALVVPQEPAVFASEVEAVYIEAFVTRKGRPALGLGAEEFVIEDNGVRQNVEVVDRALVPTTAVLLLDVSASVSGEKLAHLKLAARAFLHGMAAHDEAALVTFNDNIQMLQPPTHDRSAVLRALDKARAVGATSVIDALFVGLKRRWGSGRSLVVLFTDGKDSRSWLENDRVLEAARASSTLLYVVGPRPAKSGPAVGTASHARSLESLLRRTPGPDRAENGFVYLLRRAAETTGGAYLEAGSSDDLEARFLEILEATNTRYLLRYTPQGVERAGNHRLEISVRRQGMKVRGRKEYFVPGR